MGVRGFTPGNRNLRAGRSGAANPLPASRAASTTRYLKQ